MKNISLYQFPQNLIRKKAVNHLIERLIEVKNEGKNILLILSGGSAVQLYGKLTEVIKSGEFTPDQLAIAQIDERFLPLNKQRTKNINAVLIKQTGLWRVCKEKKIPYYLVSQEGTLGSSAEKYNKTVAGLFPRYNFRLAILGIGKDCHTAGLIPGYEKDWNIKKYAVGFRIKEGQIRERITLTPFALLRLDSALVIAAGEEKREAIDNACRKSNAAELNEYPAAVLQKIKEVEIFTDIY